MSDRNRRLRKSGWSVLSVPLLEGRKMNAKELKEKLSSCNDEAEIRIIQEEELECMPEYWDDEKHKVAGKATELFCEDLYSHEMYLLAVDDKSWL